LSDPNLLSSAAVDAIAEPADRVLVSAVCLSEIAIKRAFGKLAAPIDLTRDVAGSVFLLLPIAVPHSVMTPAIAAPS
jgi:PIN domain nuclease of toxin-antitoxin system